MKRRWFEMRRSAGSTIFDICNRLFLIIFALTIIYPFWTMVLLSFSPSNQVTSLGLKLWINEWSVNAYKFAFYKYGRMGIAYSNTIYRTVVGTGLAIFLTLAAAYPLSKKRLPGRNFLTIIILITMFFGGGLIPTYLLIRRIGLIDSRWVLILPGLVGGFRIIIVRNFMMTIDASYEEAAFMDGANYVEILFKIIVPLSKPVIATIGLWLAVWHWNSWFDALIYINSETKIVLQLLLRRMIRDIEMFTDEINRFEMVEIGNEQLPGEAIKAAVMICSIGPIIILYPFVQKYFIKGIFIGSLKG